MMKHSDARGWCKVMIQKIWKLSHLHKINQLAIWHEYRFTADNYVKIRFPDASSGEQQDYIKGQPFTLPEA